MLLTTSDPVISSLQKLPKKSVSFPTEVLALLGIQTLCTVTRGESPGTTGDHGSDSDQENHFCIVFVTEVIV
jgi:hypothetical protein